MDRREFIEKGVLAAVGTTLLGACASDRQAKSNTQPDSAKMKQEMASHSFDSLEEKVSLLGYGCMRWPMIDDGKGGQIPDQEAVNDLIDKALACGINLFDTSPMYNGGLSEKATAAALSRHPRSSYYLSTKLSNFGPENASREASMRMYENSFKQLQTDYIDFYFLHSIGSKIEDFQTRYIDNGMLDFLLEQRRIGRIRHLGFSFHGNKKNFDYFMSLHEKYHWDMVLIQMNYVDWKYATLNNKNATNAEYMYGTLSSMGIPVLIMEPLLGGRLAKIPEPLVHKLQERDPRRSVASWAFRFCASHPGVLSVLSGMTYMEHLEDNLSNFAPLEPLTVEDVDFLQDIAKIMMEYPVVPCNDCKYCIPCPYGIDIPGIFNHYNKCVNEGSIEPDSQDPAYRKARRRFLSGYDSSVDPLRQADKCIHCGQCIEKCPQEIDIPHELSRIDHYAETLRRESGL